MERPSQNEPPSSPPPYEAAVSLPPTSYNEEPPPTYGSFNFHNGVIIDQERPRSLNLYRNLPDRSNLAEYDYPYIYSHIMETSHPVRPTIIEVASDRYLRRNSDGFVDSNYYGIGGPIRSRSVSSINDMNLRRRRRIVQPFTTLDIYALDQQRRRDFCKLSSAYDLFPDF